MKVAVGKTDQVYNNAESKGLEFHKLRAKTVASFLSNSVPYHHTLHRLRFATLLAEYWASAVGSIVTVMLYGNILVMPGVVCLVMCFYWLPGIAFFDKGLGFSTVVYAALVAADIVVGSVSQAMLCLLEGADLASQKYLMNK